MQRALFLLMIESECELHLNSTYSLTELSDETDRHSPHTGRSSFFFFTFYVLIHLLSDYLLSFVFFTTILVDVQFDRLQGANRHLMDRR